MNGREIASEYRLAKWAEIMQERAASGLTVSAYCAMTGLKPNKFYYWQQKLRVAAGQIIHQEQAVAVVSTVKPDFTEIALCNPVGTERSGTLRFEIEGIEFRADEGYPAAKLLELVRGIRQLC